MSHARAKLIKTLRQILCVFNALLTISVVIQIVELITKLALKSRSGKKKPIIKSGGRKVVNTSLTHAQELTDLSVVSLSFLAGDIFILTITVIVGWIGIVTLKRRILYVYSVLMIIDVLYTIVLIIRDASTDSWLIMCDAVINISICIVMYFLIKELSKCQQETRNTAAVNGSNNAAVNGSLHRINSIVNGGYPNGSILPSPASAASALGTTLDPIDELGDMSDAALQSYLETRRATIWSNGSLICETNLPPSTYWENSMCILPYSDPPPPWSPPEDMILSQSLGLNIPPDDNNNNDHHNNLNNNNNINNNFNGQVATNESAGSRDGGTLTRRNVNGHIDLDTSSDNNDHSSIDEISSTIGSEDTITAVSNV